MKSIMTVLITGNITEGIEPFRRSVRESASIIIA